jgi:hypothetical protein
MDLPGKLTYKQLTLNDISAVDQFCKECHALGYENNSSLESMKFHSATFFAAYEQEKIISLAGVHPLSQVNKHAWRCLFRGAQLPGYTPQWSMNIFKSGIHFGQFLYRQIKYVQDIDPNAEFYISTNLKETTGAKSHRINDVMMPRIAKMGVWELHSENIILYNVPQNLWKVNVQQYMEARERWLSDENCKG